MQTIPLLKTGARLRSLTVIIRLWQTALASRVKKKPLPKLVNSDQTGFMKGLFIGDNIRLIDGIVYDTAEENLPGLLLFLDFEKAFDTLECSSIQTTKKKNT